MLRSLEEGREPWGAPCIPLAEGGDHEAGVWALACDAQGTLLVTGTEEGAVATWDARSRRTVWQARL